MNNKKKPKDILSHKQFQILRKSQNDTWTTAEWLRDQGLSENTFDMTHIRLLQAQQQAHALLKHNSDLLTAAQLKTLRHFKRLMAHKRTRDQLKPQAAYPVLNISSKINRQLFKQHRQLTQA